MAKYQRLTSYLQTHGEGILSLIFINVAKRTYVNFVNF